MGPTQLTLLEQAQLAGSAEGLPIGLLPGQIEVESRWNPNAAGHNKGGSVDRGIAQINSVAHPEITDAQAYDPAFAIPWMAKEMAGLIARCGSVVGGLEAYNSGRCSGDTGYASAVLAAAKRYGYQGQPYLVAKGAGGSAQAPVGISASAYSLALIFLSVGLLVLILFGGRSRREVAEGGQEE